MAAFRHPLHLHLRRFCRAVPWDSQACGGQVRADLGDIAVDGPATDAQFFSHLGGGKHHKQATHPTQPLGHSGQRRLQVQPGLALGLLVQRWRDLPPAALLVWLGVFYLAMLPGECAWLARALNRHAELVSLGDLAPPKESSCDPNRVAWDE